MSFENSTRIERSSINFEWSLDNRKCLAIFASPNMYFLENRRWVPHFLYTFSYRSDKRWGHLPAFVVISTFLLFVYCYCKEKN